MYAALAEAACNTYFESILNYAESECSAAQSEKAAAANAAVHAAALIQEIEKPVFAYFSALDTAFRCYMRQKAAEGKPAFADEIEKLLKKGAKTQGAAKTLLKRFNARLYRLLCSLLETETADTAETATAAETAKTAAEQAGKKQTASAHHRAAAAGDFVQKLRRTPEALTAYAAALFLFPAEDILQYYGITSEAFPLLAFWNLDEKLAELAASNGYPLKDYAGVLNTVRFLPVIYGAKGRKTVRRGAILTCLTADPVFKQQTELHEWDGVTWFSKEAAERFAEYAAVLLFILKAKPVQKRIDTKTVQNAAEKDVVRYAALLSEISGLITKSGYRLDTFEKLFIGKR